MNGEGIIAPNLWVAAMFGNPWMGFILAAVILAWAAGIILKNYLQHFRPLAHNLRVRLDATAAVDEAEGDRDAQQAFVDHYEAIETAMLSGGRKATELRHAWIEFSETLLDLNQVPLQATTRPDGYFLHLGDDTRVLAWWANIFVALGLTGTFLGIIAALVGAVRAMGGGADMGMMQKALIGLLTITAAKFWTSIGGVVASIILRWFDRRWHSWSQRSLEKISDRIERGTLYYPPQRLAAEQLQELKQQSVALTEFSHQLAASIGDALGTHLQPVVVGLCGIQQSLNEFREGGFSEIGKNVAGAINDHAGDQMNALAGALTQMTTTLDRVTSGLDGASGRASEQIAEAAAQFASASDEMLRAVRELVETARTENGAAMKQALDDFATATGDIRSAFADMRQQIATMGGQLTEGAADAAKRNAEVLAGAATALEGVMSGAQTRLGTTLDEAIARSAEQSGKAITAAFAEFRQQFAEASGGLVATLRDTAGQMGTYAGAIERSTGAATDHADRLAEAGREAQAVSTMLGRAANDVSTAAGPIRDATGAIREAVGQSGEQLRRATETGQGYQKALETITGSMERAAGSATQAWDGYRTRFADVDEALAKALNQIRDASAEHATALNTQVGRIDSALAGAADKLGAALEPLNELGERIEDVLGRLQQAAE